MPTSNTGRVAEPAPALVNRARAEAVMQANGLAALIGATYKNLYYLSGHMPDSVLGNFADVTAAAILPAGSDAPPALCASDYDLAYLTTRPTWMPELRMFSAKTRSSAAYLLEMISQGIGIETELRDPMRRLFQETRPTAQEDLVAAIVSYIGDALPAGPIRLGFDDLRLGAQVAAKLPGRVEVVDALHLFRQVRMVKTAPELALLREASAINDQAVRDAAAATLEGRPIYAMVDAYRASVVRQGARFLGERGMMFGAGPDGGFVLDNGYAERRRLVAGDIIVYDAIGTWKLYHMDIARTGVIGAPSTRLLELHDAVSEALAAAESKLRAGAHTRDCAEVARDVLVARGLRPDLTTMMFHGIGLDVLEFAQPSHKTEGWTLEADMAINFEVFHRDPTVGGVHLEDTVRVTPTGIEHFTTLPREVIIRPAA